MSATIPMHAKMRPSCHVDRTIRQSQQNRRQEQRRASYPALLRNRTVDISPGIRRALLRVLKDSFGIEASKV